MHTESTFSSVARIAVAGATGRVGLSLTRQLAKQAGSVRALTRDVAAAKLPANVEAVSVDFNDALTLEAALEGADRLFISLGSSPQQAANEIALIDAAVAKGVNHIVKVSAIGTPLNRHPFDWHREIEAHMAGIPVGYTILRPSAFNDLLSRSAKAIADGTWGGFLENGRTNFIDTRDVADAAHAVLTSDMRPGAQRIFHLTGPRSWTMDEIAKILSGLLGKEIRYEHRAREQQRELLLRSGLNEFICELLLGLEQTMADSVLGETTTTMKELTGHDPRALEDWLQENLTAFGG